MEIIANLWFLWLVLFVASAILLVRNQIARMKNLANRGLNFDIEGARQGFSKGLGFLAIYYVSATVSGVLLLIAIIIHLVQYLR